MLNKLIAWIVGFLLLGGCAGNPVVTNLRTSGGDPESTQRFAVTGMHCSGCSGGIRAELLHTHGVTQATVDHKSGLAVVRSNPKRVTSAELIKVIEEAGFEARLIAP